MEHHRRDNIGTLEQQNQAAFNWLMANFDEREREWLIDYVAAMGIPMFSQQWLPAALSGRLILEIDRAARESATTFTTVAAALGSAQARIESGLSSLERLAAESRQQQSAVIQAGVTAMKTAFQQSAATVAEQIASPLQTSIKSLESNAVKAINDTAGAAALSASKAAAANIELDVDHFLKAIGLALLIALGLGGLGGWFVTHWYDLAHRPPMHATPHTRR